MVLSYFPGCTLKTKAKELDRYARDGFAALGVTLEEIESWQCCGGVFTASASEKATKLSSVRALMHARDRGCPLVTACSACHNVIKQTNAMIRSDESFRSAVNNYLGKDGHYEGEAEAVHLLEVLRDIVGFDTLKEKVVNPLKGKKVAAYYGCLLLRPGSVMRMDDPENPRIIEDMITALGAEAVVYPYRNECCGGYVSAEAPEIAEKNSTRVYKSAKGHGADLIVTACPLCKYNLEKNGSDIPVVYFTELLAEALGVKENG